MARIDEIRIVMPYLIENWLMGSGSISVQWNGGWDGVVGALRPTDIGIIGNIFVVGLVGTAALYVQFAFALRYIRVISRRKLGSAFTSSLALWLFSLFVVSHLSCWSPLMYSIAENEQPFCGVNTACRRGCFSLTVNLCR